MLTVCQQSGENMQLGKGDSESGVERGSVAETPVEPSGDVVTNGNGNGRDPETGQFLPGNTAALQHGARSERHLERLQEQAAEALAEQRDEIAQDLGGADALSRVQQDLLERYLAASCLLGWMEAELVAKGPLTSKGKRRALHSAYAIQLDRVVKLAGMLGLERRAKPVDPLLAVRDAVARANA